MLFKRSLRKKLFKTLFYVIYNEYLKISNDVFVTMKPELIPLILLNILCHPAFSTALVDSKLRYNLRQGILILHFFHILNHLFIDINKYSLKKKNL